MYPEEWALFPCYTIINGKCSCGNDCGKDTGKHPATAHGCKDATKDRSSIIIWQERHNIALATGEPSGVWVFDVDDVADLNKLEAEYGKLPPTLIAISGSGRGPHYFFRWDERCRKLTNRQKVYGEIDVRTTGGYVILPPSKHVSGGTYSWLLPPDKCSIAFAPDWLIEVCTKPNDQKPKPQPSPVEGTCRFAASSPQFNGVFDIKNGVDLSDRAAAYCLSSPPAISGEGGQKVVFALLCRLCELFGSLSDVELLEALADWNGRCIPPWSQSELLHHLSNARAKVTGVTQQHHDDQDDEEAEVNIPSSLLPPEAYYGILGDFVKAISPETESDPGGIMMSLLASAGLAIGNSPHVRVGEGRHGTNLYVALVGNTASGKHQSWKIAESLTKKADPEFIGNVAYGLSSGEGFVERVKDDDLQDMEIQPVKKLICVEEELAKVISNMRREGNNLSAYLRTAWDCGILEAMTRGKSKLRASNAFCSILGHITQEELAKLFSNSVELVNGFSNRFLWCLVQNAQLLPHGGKTSPIIEQYREPIRQRIEYARRVGEVKRSEAANRRWEQIYPTLRDSKPGAYGKAVERAAPQVVRLSLIFALLDGSTTIDVQHQDAALGIWQYCDKSARQIFTTQLQLQADSDLENQIVEVVKTNSGITQTALRNKINTHLDANTLNAAINRLLTIGKIIVVQQGKARLFYIGVSQCSNAQMSKCSSSKKDYDPKPSGANDQMSKCSNAPSEPSEQAVEELDQAMMTAEDFCLWRAVNGVDFEWNDRMNVYWVTQQSASAITPEAETFIRSDAGQQFCRAVSSRHAKEVDRELENAKSGAISEEEFFAEMTAM